MANTLAPFGFRLAKRGAGSAPNFELIKARILHSDSTKIYRGDPVKMQSTGYIAQWTASTAVSQLWGIFSHCKYLSTSQGKTVNSPYWPGADAASGTVEAYLVPCVMSPTPVFVVQNSGTAITQADVGANADVSIGTGSTVGGCFSGATLDQSTLATTATLPFRIVGLYEGAEGANGMDHASSYNWVYVAANVNGNTGI
jgi:hypothetical protein